MENWDVSAERAKSFKIGTSIFLDIVVTPTISPLVLVALIRTETNSGAACESAVTFSVRSTYSPLVRNLEVITDPESS